MVDTTNQPTHAVSRPVTAALGGAPMLRRLLLLTAAAMLVSSGCSPGEDSAGAESTVPTTVVTTTTTTTITTTTSMAPATTTSTTTQPATTTTTVAATTTTSAGGVEAKTIEVGGISRNYLLYVPSTLDPVIPAPLVVSLHGFGGHAATQRDRDFNEVAAKEGIVVVYPDAGFGSWDLESSSDIEFITAVMDEVMALVAIDPDRVYSIGFSQGGALSTLLACRLPDRIAAVASVGALLHHDLPACPTPSSARVLTMVGTNDEIYSIREGLTISTNDPEVPGPLATEAADWATTNSCDLAPRDTSVSEGVVRQDYTCGGGAALVIYIHSGGHVWPQPPHDLGLDANTIVWEFLQQYTAPLLSG